MQVVLPVTVLTSAMVAVRSDMVATPSADALMPVKRNSTDAASTRRLQDHLLFQMCGVDLVGSAVADVANFKIPNDPDWCGISAYQLDQAATWTDDEGGTCWKKEITAYTGFGYGGRDSISAPNPRAVSFVQTGTRLPDKAVFVKQYDGYDMAGFDAGAVQRRDAADCKTTCIQTTNCFAVVWTDYQGGTCWLKRRVNVPVPKAGALSMIIARPAHAFGACPRL